MNDMSYQYVKSMWEEIGDFEGASVIQPKYRCKLCGEAIKERYHPGICYNCDNGNNEVGDYVNRVYCVSIYIKESTHDLSSEINEAKNGRHTDKMANILRWGAENFGSLDTYDILVPPPAGEQGRDGNHMTKIGDQLSEKIHTPLHDITFKTEDYPAQKTLSEKERKANVEDKIDCEDVESNVEKAIVIDDIMTTGATISNTGRALRRAGVEEVVGLAIARNESFTNLVHTGMMTEVEE